MFSSLDGLAPLGPMDNPPGIFQSAKGKWLVTGSRRHVTHHMHVCWCAVRVSLWWHISDRPCCALLWGRVLCVCVFVVCVCVACVFGELLCDECPES